jgi:hypothetical protein
MTRGWPRLVVLLLVASLVAWVVARIGNGHAWLGLGVVALLLALAVWGLALRVLGRAETPVAYLVAQHWTENVLLLQALGGIALLIMGRRVPAELFPWDHYLYGSLFPLVAVVAGRVARYRQEREYVGMAWGAFFAAALSLQAMATGCRMLLEVSCLVR